MPATIASRQRIEMHLASTKRQKVQVNGKAIDFRAGETIHTENSYKYTVESFSRAGARHRLVAAAVVDRRYVRRAGAEIRRCAARPSRASVSYERERSRRSVTPCRSVKPILGGCNISPTSRRDANIPTEDCDAWLWYPRQRWVYDKLAVALSQKLDAGPHGTTAAAFPGLLQADHQSQRHGRRQPRAAIAGRLRPSITRPAISG